MNRLDIACRRLLSQHIAEPASETPSAVVGWLGAVQAQDYAGAKWALGLRSRGVTDDAVERAFNDGAILRTHLLRPTWHFVTPADIRWMLALTAPRVHAANAHMYRKLGLDDAILERSNAALAKALHGGRQLTRDELRGVLHKARISTDGELRMGYLMMHAELDGIVCSGARRGKQFTYALLDERAPPATILTRDAALAELARRYFLSRGPATVQDFAKWSGLTLTEARRGLEAVKARLRHRVVDGRFYWLKELGPSTEAISPSAYLLSIYDELISGYRDRSAMVNERHAAKLRALGNGLSHVVVVGDRIAGTWSRTLKPGAVVIETNTFARLTAAESRAVTAAANRYGEFLGLAVVP